MCKELEALESIKREAGVPYFSTLYDIDMWREDFSTVETALKALGTIKKYVNLEDDDGVYWLNLKCCASITIKKEEFDLLKEILCLEN